MKRIISLILFRTLVLSLSACGKVEITMQEIYNAVQTEAMFKNHQSVYVQNEMDGEVWCERYLTKDYVFTHIPSEESDWAEFMTDDARYCDVTEGNLLYLYITPDGVSNFASERADKYTSFILGEDALDQTIESVSEKDGRITVTSILSQKNLEALVEDGVTAGKFEYVLDAKTREVISITSDYTFTDGTSYQDVTKISYDAETPEMLKTFLAYQSQTENLRSITVVSNPGTDKEETKSIQAPKGLIIGFEYDDALEGAAGFYADAACTQNYDPFGDTDSDLTIYVKWTE